MTKNSMQDSDSDSDFVYPKNIIQDSNSNFSHPENIFRNNYINEAFVTSSLKWVTDDNLFIFEPISKIFLLSQF